MDKYYTLQQAMDLLGLRSKNAFLHLERKYPDAFVNVNPKKDRAKRPWYDKAALDRFHQLREYFKEPKQ